MKFDTVKLGEYLYIKGRIGWKGLKKEEYLASSPYRIINGESLTQDGIDWNRAGFISKERYDESPEIMLQEGDILLSKDGTIGKIGYVTNLEHPTTVASGIFVIRNLRPQTINTRFIYHFLTSKTFKNFITMRTEGSVIPHLYQKDFVELDFPLPSLTIQEKIVSILDAISGKIDLNKAINNNLLEQAQALYTSMFISNADPTWRQGHLSDLITVRYGKDHKKLADGAYPVYGSGGIMRYAERPLYERESVLIPRKGTLNNVMYVNEPFWSVDTMFYTEMRIPNVAKYVYHFVKSKDLASLNAGSAVPSMTTEILNAMELLIPSESALAKFEAVVAPMYKAMKDNDIQVAQLVKLRDTLLPKLMSGEVDVSAIEI